MYVSRQRKLEICNRRDKKIHFSLYLIDILQEIYYLRQTY
jgi:hypothetical protein